MRVCGVNNETNALKTVDFFVSHEGLQLCYEEALTRSMDPFTRNSENSPRTYYNLGTHFLWIGDRTRQLDHAHVEYFRGIANPIGIKVGPSSDPTELVKLIQRLWPNPSAMPGKIVLITRMGAASVSEKLPIVVKAVQAAQFSSPVVWVCDPMHGNTRVVAGSGLKTREFDDILSEIRQTFDVHRKLNSRLGGVHFELTGENVTECTGGPEQLLEHDLPRRYTTYCDPVCIFSNSFYMKYKLTSFLI
jgi:3-deoxy-7-phosphoheptulonate synthase